MRIITPYKYFADHSDEWLAKEIPTWFSEPKKRRADLQDSQVKAGTIKSCPSFVDIFRNSLVLRAPCDCLFNLLGDNYEFISGECANHKMINFEYHDIKSQMNQEWANDYIHMKLNFNAQMVAETRSKCLFFPPEYHFEEELSIIKPMLGAVNLLPNTGVEFNINMLASKRDFLERKEVLIRKGTPLAYVYFPFEEKVSVEYLPQSEFDNFSFTKTSFSGDYLKAVMKGKENDQKQLADVD